MMEFSVPPGYRRGGAPKRPKLDPFTAIIDQILEADRTAYSKQHHTLKRVFERLRNEYGYGAASTTFGTSLRPGSSNLASSVRLSKSSPAGTLRAISDLTLDKLILQEAARGNF